MMDSSFLIVLCTLCLVLRLRFAQAQTFQSTQEKFEERRTKYKEQSPYHLRVGILYFENRLTIKAIGKPIQNMMTSMPIKRPVNVGWPRVTLEKGKTTKFMNK